MKRKFTFFSIILSVLILSSLSPQADTQEKKGLEKVAPGQSISGQSPKTKLSERTPKSTATPTPKAKPAEATPQVARVLPLPAANPDFASQSDFDSALYTTEEFFGNNSRIIRAYPDARKQLGTLIARYPKDPKLPLTAALLDERLENFDQAAKEMNQYVALNSSSIPALRRLANFYHNRALFKEQVETLQKVAAKLRVEEREPVYREIISVVKDHEVKGFSIEAIYKELLETDKQNVGLVKSYVEELALKKRYPQALEVLNTYQDKYPDELRYFLQKRSSIYQEQGDRTKAETVYKEAFDPLWPSEISTDYYELLRKIGRYRNYRRSLQTEAAHSTSFDQTTRLFGLYAYEQNTPLAFNLLKNYEKKRGEQANWKRQELETLAGLFVSIGQYDESSRYLYTLYLSEGLKTGTTEREKYLFKLFKVLMDSQAQPVSLSRGDLSLYRDIAKVDQNPGLLNGVLSLILSNTNIGSEFQQKENNAASYFNRSFAYRIFNNFKQEYANSDRLPLMYQDLMAMFAGFGEHKLVITLGKEFQAKFPSAPNYNQVTLKIADSLVALGQRDAERALLIQLLDKTAEKNTDRVLLPSSRTVATSDAQFEAVVDDIIRDITFFSDTYNPVWLNKDNGNDNYNTNYNTYSNETNRVDYSTILERIVSSYGTEGKKQETLKFFWGEVKKHPKEEGLYERTLKWLESANLLNEQFKVYTAALDKFQDNTWSNRLARWYIRNKKRTEFQAYSKEVVEIFDQDDVKEYLNHFAAMNYNNVSDVNYDSNLYFQLYSYALKRFPNNVAFVNGLLRYYAIQKNWAEWEKLSFQYYPFDPVIRENLLRYLAANKKLKTVYDQASRKAKTSLSYQLFSADAAIKLSHFNEALDTYKILVANYPGETQYSLKLADLMRSYSYQDDKFSEESAKVYLQLARIYPTNHDYKTKAGEVFADMSDFTRAHQAWDSILNSEQGVANTYLEVASIYWDYYQFDDAARVIKDYRVNTGDKTALAYKLGAIYEGKNDWKQAINEYVSVLSENGVGRDVVIKRLVQLTPRRDFAQLIARSYDQQANSDPSNWLLTLGYSEYLRSAGRETESDNLLRDQVAKRSELEFLETIRDIFHRERLPQDEEQTIIRLGQLARDEREIMKYRLQLALFYEQKQDQKASQVFDKLLAEYPSNLGVIQEASQYYSRAGLVDKAIALFKQSLNRAKGDYQRQFTLQLAARLDKANKLDEAEQTLRTWYKDHPLDNEFFRNLVAVLGKANKQDALVELYQAGLKQPATSGLSGDEAKAYIINLRLAMIETLVKLNRPSEVVDQYIEVINRQFDNSSVIDAAFRYAQANNQLDRFIKYYEDTSKKSYKDYRWNLVLGAIYAANGDVAKEIDQYKLALTNEPQRLDLRETLAGLYTREQRFDEAVAALRRNFEIDGNNPDWLTKVAKVQIQAGKPDAAVATLRDGLSRNPKVTAQLLFNAGKLLSDRAYTKQAFDFYKEAVALIKSKPTKESLGAEEFANYSLALLKNTNPVTTYQEIKALETKLEAVPSEEDEKNYASSSKYTVESFLRDRFGGQVLSVCTPKERLDLANSLTQSAKAIKAYDTDNEANIRKILAVADNAGLTESQENILLRMKDLSFGESSSKYYNNVLGLLAFYDRYGMYTKAAEMLQAEKKLGRWKKTKEEDNSVDWDRSYYELISDYLHKAGLAEREVAALSEYYKARSGSATTDSNPLIQRYLSLLVELNKKDELKQLCAKSNPYQLQLINFLILQREKELALQAIDNSPFSTAWKASRRGQVGLYFQDTNSQVEGAFLSALNLDTIGKQVNQTPNEKKVLIGSDWYVAASNYGVWLSLTTDKAAQAHKYIVARVEDKPKDAIAQLELANFYINNKTFKLAEQHLALASELAPNSAAIQVAQGNYFFMRGDREKALSAWNSLIAKRNAGLAQYNSYFDALASHELTAQTLPSVGRFLSRAVNKISWDELSPFIRKVAIAGKTPALSTAVADMFYQVIRDNPNNVKLGEMLLQEDLINSTEGKTALYRVMLERYQDLLLAVNLSGGIYRDSDYFSQERVKGLLDNQEKRFIDFLIFQRQFDQARQNLRYMQDSHQELSLTITPEWMEMAQAVIDLRTNNTANALTALRRYVGLTNDQQSATNTSDDRYLKAYTLLVNEKQNDAADQLLYDYYQSQLRMGQGTIANYTGVAGVEFRRGHNKEALDWLQKMTAIIGSAEASIEAGKLAERYGLHKEAFDWRDRGAKLDPSQAENRLELARNAGLIGQNQLGINTLKQLIENRETNNSIRAEAVALIPIVAGSKDIALATLPSFQNNPDYYSQLITAGLLIAADRKPEARLVLQQAGKITTAAQARLMLAGLEVTEKTANAKTALQDALYADGKEVITQAIAFNLDDPKSSLVQAFVANNQLNAALAFSPIQAERTMLTEEGEEDSSQNSDSSSNNSDDQSNLHSFNYQEINTTDKEAKYLTLVELASKRRKTTDKELLAVLVDVAIKVRDLPQAIDLLKLYQAKVNTPEQFAILDQKRKELSRQVTSAQAVEQASLKLGTELTQSVLDQLLTKTINSQIIDVSGEGL